MKQQGERLPFFLLPDGEHNHAKYYVFSNSPHGVGSGLIIHLVSR